MSNLANHCITFLPRSIRGCVELLRMVLWTHPGNREPVRYVTQFRQPALLSLPSCDPQSIYYQDAVGRTTLLWLEQIAGRARPAALFPMSVDGCR